MTPSAGQRQKRRGLSSAGSICFAGSPRVPSLGSGRDAAHGRALGPFRVPARPRCDTRGCAGSQVVRLVIGLEQAKRTPGWERGSPGWLCLGQAVAVGTAVPPAPAPACTGQRPGQAAGTRGSARALGFHRGCSGSLAKSTWRINGRLLVLIASAPLFWWFLLLLRVWENRPGTGRSRTATGSSSRNKLLSVTLVSVMGGEGTHRGVRRGRGGWGSAVCAPAAASSPLPDRSRRLAPTGLDFSGMA